MRSLRILSTHKAPGRGPVGLAGDGRTLWNTDFTTGSLYQLDLNTLQPQRNLVCPGNLCGLAWDGQSLWQSTHHTGGIHQINPVSDDIDGTTIIENHGWLAGLAWDGNLLWAVSQQQGHLLAIAPETGGIVQRWDIPTAAGGLDFHRDSLWLGVPISMVFDPAFQVFEWVGDERQFALLQINPHNGQELARYPLDFLPMGLAWIGEELWMSHTGAGQLLRAQLTD